MLTGKIFSKVTNLFITVSIAFSISSCSHRDISISTDTINTVKSQSNAVKGQYVVKFKQTLSTATIMELAKNVNATVIKIANRLSSAVLEFSSSSLDLTQQLEALKSDANVEFVEPNYQYKGNYTVNDPKSSQQGGLALAGLAKAWDITMGDPKIIIGIVDTGADLNHPDLKNKLVAGYNVITQGKTPPMDDNGHGTHTAGIAGADTDNKIGIAGAAPKCKVMPVKALDAKGSGDIFNVALGIIWAVDHGAKVLSLSLGGPENETVKRAVNYALLKNVVVVAAMGNDGKNVKAYPAAIPGVIAVGSVDANRSKSDFSNYGNWMSVMAPGSQIMSTLPTYTSTMSEEEFKSKGYDYLDGTSMACPIVAGIAALMLSRNPDYTPAEVKERLESTATHLGKDGFNPEYAHGLVNAAKAVL
ncbi:MAG: peptidase S8 [Candidatus Sericytochromatia bacterium]|nr:peptidase S8 [Candidatus Sericytochromatia bacterium]